MTPLGLLGLRTRKKREEGPTSPIRYNIESYYDETPEFSMKMTGVFGGDINKRPVNE